MTLSDTLDQLDLIKISIFHPQIAEYTFFSSAHGTFSKIGHMLVHKSLNKFKRIEIIPNICSKHNGMKLEINYRKKNGRKKNTWRLNNMLLKKKSVVQGRNQKTPLDK